ncbi:uncharacterized protein LOC132309469 [Cornus florida]|uniref:uncharacterized protein LOC132309469 n=1 Tax=Cornus florida TaxID=4283 RepID=UPI0028A147E1|nr:uncharacterized protein LOC132309469 [Cornus florida]
MGDFNAITSSNERFGGSQKWSSSMSDLKDCIQQAELEGLKYNGLLYTWNNKSLGDACIARKIDRALVVQKLKKLKHILKSTCRKEFSDVGSRLDSVKLELDSCQTDLDNCPNDIHLRQLEMALIAEYLRLGKVQEDMLRQKSRMIWLKLGDSNSSYFHKSLASRINRNKIVSLTTAAGVVIVDPEAIKQETISHFQRLLGCSILLTYGPSDLSQFITKSVPSNLLSLLESPPSPLEIQNCMLSLNRDKAPGPDGYNALFFQKTWHIVGNSIIKAISKFFRNGKLLSEINCTYISLVPKCSNPSFLNDYRPISCCNIIYKCIAKLLASKLQLTLPHIIDTTQTAFVQGRKITDSILLAHVLLRGYHKDIGPPRCAIKIDLMKAFDSKGSLPIRHLGVPLITTNLKSSDCRTLIERITHRISHWSARSLSYAGRLQLLKAVLVSIQLYWSSIFVLPKSVINELNKIFRSFLWSGPELKSTGSKVAWYNVCRPKAEGGLDIPNLEVANRAAILRYIWDLHTDNSDRVWINWCRIYLIKNRSFWSLKIPQPCSWSWRKILQLRHPARLIIKHIIGNGMDTNFWLDNWSPAGPLSLCFPSHILSNLGADEFTPWSFPHSLSNAVPELLALPQPCSTRKDKLIWLASPSSTFNLKHTTLHLASNGDQIAWCNLVWCSPTIPRMKFNMWLAAQSRLPTLDSRAMASHDNICALCNSEPESHSHLFFRCIFSSPLWKFIQDRCKFYKPFLSWEDMILWISHRWKGSSPINMLRKICLLAMVYHIWEERNNRIFKGKSSLQRLVLTKVSNTITSIPQLRCLKDCETSRSILQSWNLSPACCRPPPRPLD